jgi:hypothetical protein
MNKKGTMENCYGLDAKEHIERLNISLHHILLMLLSRKSFYIGNILRGPCIW